MVEFFARLNEYKDVIIVLAALVALIPPAFQATTAFLDRKDRKRPQLLVHLHPSERNFHVLELTFSNVGEGAARDIRFRTQVACSEEEAERFNGGFFCLPGHNSIDRIDGLPAGHSFSVQLGLAPHLLNSDLLWPAKLSVHMRDMNNQEQAVTLYSLDPRSLKGLRKIGDNPANDTADATKKMADLLNRLVSGDTKFEVNAIVESAEQAERRRDREQKEIEEYWKSRRGN